MAITPGGRVGDASPLGPKNLFATPGDRLPTYVREVANSLLRTGRAHSKGEAISLAIGALRRWAHGGGNVKPAVRAAAVKALAEWEAAKGLAHATPNKGSK